MKTLVLHMLVGLQLVTGHVALESHCRPYHNRTESGMSVACIDSGDCTNFTCSGIYSVMGQKIEFCSGVQLISCDDPPNLRIFTNIPNPPGGRSAHKASNIISGNDTTEIEGLKWGPRVTQVQGYSEVIMVKLPGERAYNVSVIFKARSQFLGGLTLWISYLQRTIIRDVHIDISCPKKGFPPALPPLYYKCTPIQAPKAGKSTAANKFKPTVAPVKPTKYHKPTVAPVKPTKYHKPKKCHISRLVSGCDEPTEICHQDDAARYGICKCAIPAHELPMGGCKHKKITDPNVNKKGTKDPTRAPKSKKSSSEQEKSGMPTSIIVLIPVACVIGIGAIVAVVFGVLRIMRNRQIRYARHMPLLSNEEEEAEMEDDDNALVI